MRALYAVHVTTVDGRSKREADGAPLLCCVNGPEIRLALLGGRRNGKGVEPCWASVSCAGCGKPIQERSDLRPVIKWTAQGRKWLAAH